MNKVFSFRKKKKNKKRKDTYFMAQQQQNSHDLMKICSKIANSTGL